MAQKKRLVNVGIKEVSHAYEGLRVGSRIDYDQFAINDDDGKTFYWMPGDKKIRMSAMKGKFGFLALSSLASDYGHGGTNAVRTSLRLTGFTSKIPRLNEAAAKVLQQEDENLGTTAANYDNIPSKISLEWPTALFIVEKRYRLH